MDLYMKQWPGAAAELKEKIGSDHKVKLWHNDILYELAVESIRNKPFGLRCELTANGARVVIETTTYSDDVTVIFHTPGGDTP